LDLVEALVVEPDRVLAVLVTTLAVASMTPKVLNQGIIVNNYSAFHSTDK